MTAQRHLVHIGFPKAGSTTLAAWFSAHPRLGFAHDGLGGFHSAFAVGAAAAEARAPVEWHVTSSESLSSPRPSDAPSLRDRAEDATDIAIAESRARVCRTLRLMLGDATILIVTRGFRGALASNYSQYVRTGGRVTVEGLFAPNARQLATYLDYDAVVSLYEEEFGPEQVIVLPYELLRDAPERFVAVLEERLGISGGPPLPALNPGLSPAAVHWYRALSAGIAPVAGRLGTRAGGRAWSRYVAVVAGDRLERPAAWLARVFPSRVVTAANVPDAVVAACRGRARRLGSRPLYGPYAAEYLNTPRDS